MLNSDQNLKIERLKNNRNHHHHHLWSISLRLDDSQVMRVHQTTPALSLCRIFQCPCVSMPKHMSGRQFFSELHTKVLLDIEMGQRWTLLTLSPRTSH